MNIKADKKYHGVVAAGSELIQSQNAGTLGYQVNLECEDGDTSYTIWLTPKNRERAEKTFTEALGVPREKLLNGNYIELQCGIDITGREVTFTTVEEEYKGKSKVKVAFLFRRSVVAGGSPGKAAAAFFGGTANEPSHIEGGPITDEDIPFRYRTHGAGHPSMRAGRMLRPIKVSRPA